MPNIVKRMYEKREFLVLVFSNLLAQLGITAAAIEPVARGYLRR